MPIKFVFVISPKTHFLDLAGPDQVFSEAIFYKAPFELEYGTYAQDAGTSSGLHFARLKHFSEVPVKKGDYVFIPGMDLDVLSGPNREAVRDLLTWLKEAYSRQVNLCSVCTGAFLLAAGGFLDGRHCTTHWKYTQKLQRLRPAARVLENVLYTDRDGILTSAGIASGIDLALYIVEKEKGAYFANKVAREIVVYIRRDGNAAQQSIFLCYRNHLHSGIHAVQDWLVDNLEKKATLLQLASLANMSTRNFTRIFKKETGITIGDYVGLLRRERIRELLKKPDLSRSQVARQVGLMSERQLSRLMKN
ncbi:MAG: GlxA family transcriptional regulator [Saprospiraceae bacterium]